MTTLLFIVTVIVIIAYIAVLAIYLFIVGNQLTRIADNLDETNEAVKQINADARVIGPGVEHINRTGGVVAAALPLLYGFAERIVVGVTPREEEPAERVAVPASGTRRSRLHDTVGYRPGD
jgi:hypothetical protein